MADQVEQVYFNPFDPEYRANPYPSYKLLRGGPPRQLNLFLPVTLVARYADVIAVLRDYETFSSERPESGPRIDRSVPRRADDRDRRSACSHAPAQARRQSFHAVANKRDGAENPRHCG